MKIEFIKSAKVLKDCPNDAVPEVALAGRSNAGKSSFLNALANRKVAMVSQQPGKTRLLNFFQAGAHYRLVDMPGYGFAARSGEEQMSWRAMVEDFLRARENLRGLLLIMDARRTWSAEEQLLWNWLSPQGLPLALVMNKIDKLNRSELARRQRELKTELGELAGQLPVFWVSSQKKTGVKDVEEFLYNEWIAAGEPS